MEYSAKHRSILSSLKAESPRYEVFLAGVVKYFEKSRDHNQKEFPAIYAINSRVKSDEHILRKIKRKADKGINITKQNVFQEITDFCGVRILHMHIGQFETIHKLITKQVKDGDWVFHEHPVANFWDPDLEGFYRDLGLAVDIRETLYTSVHYLVKPRADVHTVCEIQVRNLFEEIWGEVDHFLNYPEVHKSQHCRRQLRVLSKLVCSGSRLVDSIFESANQP